MNFKKLAVGFPFLLTFFFVSFITYVYFSEFIVKNYLEVTIHINYFLGECF